MKIQEKTSEKIDSLEKMDEALGPAIAGESRMVFEGTSAENIQAIIGLLKTNFSVTLWTKGWDSKEKEEVSALLDEWKVVWAWDETMDAFLCFRSEEDLQSFYQTIADKYGLVFEFEGEPFLLDTVHDAVSPIKQTDLKIIK